MRALLLTGVMIVMGMGSAQATEFSFSYTGAGVSTSGLFEATALNATSYLVTSASGLRNGQAITLIGTNGYASNDNKISTVFPSLTFAGLSFVAGGLNYNLSYGPVGATTGYAEASDVTGISGNAGVQIAFSLNEVVPASVPEPASLALLAVGMIGAGVIRGRRKA